MQKTNYLGSNLLVWLLIIGIAVMVIGGYRQAQNQEAAAQRLYAQCMNTSDCAVEVK